MAKILIIENDLAMTTVLNDMLSAEDYSTIAAVDAAEGLALAQEEKPDLIVLDIMLTDQSGVEVLNALREDNDWGKNVPVIVMTSLTYLENMSEIKAKSNDFIYKGDFKLETLVERIKQLLP